MSLILYLDNWSGVSFFLSFINLNFSFVNSNWSANFAPSIIFFSRLIADVVLGEGTSKAIINDVGKGGSVSTSPAVKSLSITQDLSVGSQRTKATPPSTVFAAATAVPPSFLGDDKISVGF